MFLLASGNWNNGVNAGLAYRNSNNVASNCNRNIGTHLYKLRIINFIALNNAITSTLMKMESNINSFIFSVGI